MTLKYGILGCGPSGLIAAHAVASKGFTPIIYSIKKPSKQYGAQYLHAPIPGVTENVPHGEVKYILRGTREGYAEKVYGNPDHAVSFGVFTQDHKAWDLRLAYRELWEMYSPLIINRYITRENLRSMVMGESCDFWISTMPAEDLCVGLGHHQFPSQPVWATVKPVGVDTDEENWVCYNGEHDRGWYRASKVFGHNTVEWPFYPDQEPPQNGWFLRKPLWTNCDCWPQIMRTGRYGLWQKGVLTHHVWDMVLSHVYDTAGV